MANTLSSLPLSLLFNQLLQIMDLLSFSTVCISSSKQTWRYYYWFKLIVCLQLLFLSVEAELKKCPLTKIATIVFHVLDYKHGYSEAPLTVTFPFPLSKCSSLRASPWRVPKCGYASLECTLWHFHCTALTVSCSWAWYNLIVKLVVIWCVMVENSSSNHSSHLQVVKTMTWHCHVRLWRCPLICIHVRF